MKIREFGVERWMDLYETRCRYNLSESCVHSLTLAELLDLTGRRNEILGELERMQLTYGAITGSERLREQIASLYTSHPAAHVLVAHGAIGANALVHQALVGPGERVVSIVPTYQQHTSLPECFAAEVVELQLRERNGFLPDLDELRSLVGRRTRLITLCNPNNPTGSLMDAAMLGELCAIARSAGAYVLCDEVYRGLDQHGDGFTVSIADLYERGISTGSMSKVYSLAGLRLGWLVAPPEVVQQAATHRDYTTISVGMIDDYLAAVALEHRDRLLARNHRIVRSNLAMLDAWQTRESRISYVRPKSGTTALLKYALDKPSRDFCVDLIETTGVLTAPGSAFGMEGYVRIGYANAQPVLEAGLAEFSRYLAHA